LLALLFGKLFDLAFENWSLVDLLTLLHEELVNVSDDGSKDCGLDACDLRLIRLPMPALPFESFDHDAPR
jgi:hypothetical protein